MRARQLQYVEPYMELNLQEHPSDCMPSLDYESCKADPDVWVKQFFKPSGTKCYDYILLYVDDALCVNHDAQSELEKLNKFFKMKPGSIGDPDIHLGGKLTQFEVKDSANINSQLTTHMGPVTNKICPNSNCKY